MPDSKAVSSIYDNLPSSLLFKESSIIFTTFCLCGVSLSPIHSPDCTPNVRILSAFCSPATLPTMVTDELNAAAPTPIAVANMLFFALGSWLWLSWWSWCSATKASPCGLWHVIQPQGSASNSMPFLRHTCARCRFPPPGNFTLERSQTITMLPSCKRGLVTADVISAPSYTLTAFKMQYWCPMEQTPCPAFPPPSDGVTSP
mmetsp:Transcript_38833/g.91355  ORF Transcript_38833/g.91355 Transcript_38833/m.91355 type:complete len:202 (-) Transcript_38833:945-1550(-)